MIRISNTAQAHFAKLLENQKKGTQIRIFVINPGTPNAESSISYCPPDTIKESDTALKFEKLIVYVDRISALYLKDAEIDLIINQFGSQLTLKAPNVKVCQIDDNAPLTERIEHFLQSQINLKLASHGGHVSLVEITKKGYAVLHFSGACNGCSMINITLKDGIERQILNRFPELEGVLDITNHQKGKHSYC